MSGSEVDVSDVLYYSWRDVRSGETVVTIINPRRSTVRGGFNGDTLLERIIVQVRVAYIITESLPRAFPHHHAPSSQPRTLDPFPTSLTPR